MASSFTLSGLLNMSFDLTNTQTIGSVADTTNVLEQFGFENGTGAGQANAYIRLTGTVPATETYVYTSLTSIAAPNQFGGTTSVSLQSVRMLYCRNTSATQFMSVGFANQGSVWWSFDLNPRGFVVWSAGDATAAQNASATDFTELFVRGEIGDATPIGYELILVGVKA